MNFVLPAAAATRAPAATVVLPVLAPAVPVDAVRAGTDRFRCAPYACVLTASACVRRQQLVGASQADRDAGGRLNSERLAVRAAGTPYRACADCADGRLVAAAIAN